MKKLLILVVVLALTSVASAVIEPVPSPGAFIGSFTLGAVDWTLDYANNRVIGTGTALGVYDESLYIYPSSFAGTSDTSEAGKGAYAAAGNNGGFTGTGVLVAHAEDIAATTQTLGEWFYLNLTPGSDGQFTLLSSDGAGNWDVGLTAAVVNGVITPEPMTIALLGLGGLFLRRRKVA